MRHDGHVVVILEERIIARRDGNTRFEKLSQQLPTAASHGHLVTGAKPAAMIIDHNRRRRFGIRLIEIQHVTLVLRVVRNVLKDLPLAERRRLDLGAVLCKHGRRHDKGKAHDQ